MDIKVVEFQGIPYLVPETFKFAHETVEEYDSYCGSGDGIGDKIVPETIFGKRVSHICHIHDHSWTIADDSFLDFFTSNAMFLFNLVVCLMGSKPTLMGYLRGARALTYFMAVNTIGHSIFNDLKKMQRVSA